MSPASWTSAAAALSVAGLLAHVPCAEAHLYMMTPMTRNLYATAPYIGQGGPNINHCPHCFQSRGPAAVRARGGDAPWPHFNGERAENGNYIESEEVAKRHGICGDPEQTAAEGDNRYGLANSNYLVHETYAEGSILEVKIVVSTNHWGHIEMFLCDAADLPDGPEDSAVTQECLNKYPLDRAADDDFNSPIDPNNRGRMILDPMCRAGETDQTMVEGAYAGDVATARFQLPAGVTCERCIVQMAYYTGNSCQHQGYAEFNPPSWPSDCAPNKADWINEDVSFCGDGDSYPEEFWNCADIAITSGGEPGPSPPRPAPTPASDDDSEEYPAPTPEEYPAPSPEEYPAPTPEPETPMDCEDPVGQYRQCGGTDFMGSTCCETGFECTAMADCYSECRPSTTEEVEPVTEPEIDDTDCADEWGQCGGIEWDGPMCCKSGLTCTSLGDWYHQCRGSSNY